MKACAVFFAVALAAAVTSAGKLYLERPKTSRIINGEEAEVGEFPHQISLQRFSSGRWYHTCGGSVIADDWVLTAGHCVQGVNKNNLQVVVGLHDIDNTPGSITFSVDNVAVHDDYNRGDGAFPNDVALLRLTPNANDINKNIITLASGNTTFAGTKCVISGWGVTELGNAAKFLMKADVTALSVDECKVYWGNNTQSQHICVKGEGTTGTGSGACNGDSGGPLVCQGVLAGVTSWGRSGCHDGDGEVTHPSVYARVSYFNNWINTTCDGCL